MSDVHIAMVMSPAHLVLPYTHLFLLFSTSLIHHYTPHRCDLMCKPPCSLAYYTPLCSIRLALLIWWTDDLQFTCFISILSYPTCALLWLNQSWSIAPCSQALTIASLQMSLVCSLSCLSFVYNLHVFSVPSQFTRIYVFPQISDSVCLPHHISCGSAM